MVRGGIRLVALLSVGPAVGCSSQEQSTCAKCVPGCETVATTPVAWGEATAFGSPEQLFSAFMTTCQAPFVWDASGWSGTLTVTPLQGATTLTTTLTLDIASASMVTQTPSVCSASLRVDGVATLTLPEGHVADHQPFTLAASAATPPGVARFRLEEAGLGPWVSIAKSDPSSTVSMTVTIISPMHACAGQVSLGVETVGEGVGSGAIGDLAHWGPGN